MALDTRHRGGELPPKRDSRGGVPQRAGRQPPRRGMEFAWWAFMRVSGVILLFLVVGHVLMSLAIVHGINGLRVIILDYVRRPAARIAVTWFFYVVGIVLFALGSIVVFTFDAARWHA